MCFNLQKDNTSLPLGSSEPQDCVVVVSVSLRCLCVVVVVVDEAVVVVVDVVVAVVVIVVVVTVVMVDGRGLVSQSTILWMKKILNLQLIG